ncbi:MAG: TylF/MycF/NovP-related O-methyltransferase [Flavisolibacter sp.]
MIKEFIRKLLNKNGYDVIKLNKAKQWPVDFEDIHKRIIEKVQPFTMTEQGRIFGLIEAVRYLAKNRIKGDIVECGVWRGGSMLAIADLLVEMGDIEHDLFLFDTFEGMPAPSEKDVSYTNKTANELLLPNVDKTEDLIWAYSSLDAVKETMSLSDYPKEKIHYVQGKVEDTLPTDLLGEICLLRLDTDWYESTKHELIHLYPKLVKGGIIIIDDYGFWKGARKAVDEYFTEQNIPLLLNRLDETGRIAIKTY